MSPGTHGFRMRPFEFEWALKSGDEVIRNDYKNIPKPKLMCRFKHKWFSHVLVLPPLTYWRTICDRCKINQDVWAGKAMQLPSGKSS